MPRLLDLYCKAGGAGMGYSRAGFEVVGVDIEPQPRYPFEFHQGDAIEYVKAHGHEFDAIHASPVCKEYAKTKHLNTKRHPMQIEDIREVLLLTSWLFVIENVPGSPLINPVAINGPMVELNLIDRERWFECHGFEVPFSLMVPTPKPVKMGRPVKEGEIIQVVGNFSGVPYARKAMGIDWMTQGELAQAIPPAYTEYIGGFLMKALKAAA